MRTITLSLFAGIHTAISAFTYSTSATLLEIPRRLHALVRRRCYSVHGSNTRFPATWPVEIRRCASAALLSGSVCGRVLA